MVNHSPSARTTQAGLGIGAVAAASAVVAFGFAGGQAVAQEETSTAYGVSASGIEAKGPQPSVSSTGAVKTASGSVSGMGWRATGITVRTGAGLAEAIVGNVTVANRNLGSVSATCRDGATTYTHSGSAPNDPKLRVSFGGGAGATIQILGADDKPAQTITVAVARCGRGAPPTTTPQPTTPPTGQPTQPAPPATGQPTQRSVAGSGQQGGRPITPAPRPRPQDGHHPVTG